MNMIVVMAVSVTMVVRVIVTMIMRMPMHHEFPRLGQRLTGNQLRVNFGQTQHGLDVAVWFVRVNHMLMCTGTAAANHGTEAKNDWYQ